jgi:Saxitoxin biosynthesis operon protein SxtJ
MIRQEIKELKTGTKELRKFGLLVGGVFAALGILYYLRGKPIFPWFVIPGGLLIFFGLIFPKALKLVYLVWMTLAILLGFVVSHVLLTVLFYLAVTPVGLLARLCGKDFLGLKPGSKASSYWIARNSEKPRSKLDYEQQF